MSKLKQKNLGFTLIELLVVSTIIIVLATIGVVSYRSASMNSRNAKRKTDLEVVRQAMIMYRSEEGSYPSVANFNAAISTLVSAGYLTSGTEIADPRGGTYTYEAVNKLLYALLEPDNTQHNVSLP